MRCRAREKSDPGRSDSAKACNRLTTFLDKDMVSRTLGLELENLQSLKSSSAMNDFKM